MASLSLKHIYKVYDGGVKAVNDFCMEIEDKEFIVFVGPSGCGKSTTLRMIAGLEEITAGELMIGDEVVNDVEPKDRNIAMVFQNYALYPHMTVRENMAFALRLQKDLSEEEIMSRVDEAAKRLDIAQFLERKPRALSGGQRQRVSLGRAIVRNPKVFLLDEPLSNLDAKLRAQMRTEIAKLHKQLATTFIYVTHDQVEAMTMGTRIVVMKFGVVQQIDTPKNLYDYPGNKFVASFIGTPQMNFFDATLKRISPSVVEIAFANDRKIRVPAECLIKADDKYFDGETVVTIGIRPEDVHIEEDFVAAHKDCSLDCNIGILEALGSESIVYCELDPTKENVAESETRLTLKVDPRKPYDIDQAITVAFDPTRIHIFDKETEMSIMPRIPEKNVVEGSVTAGVVDFGGVKFKLPASVSLADGEYDFDIPSDAFFFDNSRNDLKDFREGKIIFEGEKYVVPHDEIAAKYLSKAFVSPITPISHEEFLHDTPKAVTSVKVESTEIVGKKTLYRLAFGKKSVFAVGEGETLKSANLNVSVDWKRVSVLKGEEKIVCALSLTNALTGKLLKERAGKSNYNFGLEIGGRIFYTTEYVEKKLFNAAGRKAFTIKLDYDFSPYAVKIASDGIAATVDEILDYGAEKFAVCSVGDKKIAVFIGDDAIAFGEEVKLSIDLSDLGIVEADRGIRII